MAQLAASASCVRGIRITVATLYQRSGLNRGISSYSGFPVPATPDYADADFGRTVSANYVAWPRGIREPADCWKALAQMTALISSQRCEDLRRGAAIE